MNELTELIHSFKGDKKQLVYIIIIIDNSRLSAVVQCLRKGAPWEDRIKTKRMTGRKLRKYLPLCPALIAVEKHRFYSLQLS